MAPRKKKYIIHLMLEEITESEYQLDVAAIIADESYGFESTERAAKHAWKIVDDRLLMTIPGTA